jgi:hypothetical protein
MTHDEIALKEKTITTNLIDKFYNAQDIRNYLDFSSPAWLDMSLDDIEEDINAFLSK